MAEIINHPLYDEETTDYDYAIIKLSQPVLFGRHANAACLPKNDGETYADKNLIVSGWGALQEGGGSPDILQVSI